MDEHRHSAVPDGPALVGLFRQASRLMARAYHRRDHAQHAQELILSILRRHGPMNQRDLLDILDVRSASLSEVLGKLERGDLIARQRDDQDKRGYVISLTEQGSTRSSDVEDIRTESADALFAGLDDGERETLGRLLAKIVASLADDPQNQENRQGCPGRHRGCGRGGRAGRHGPGGRFFPGERDRFE